MGKSGMGANVFLDRGEQLRIDALLFGEAQGRIVVSCDARSVDDALRIAKKHGVPCRQIGQVVAAEDGFRVEGRSATLEAKVWLSESNWVLS